MDRLIITQKDYESVIAHCKEALPREACGLMAGCWYDETGIVTKIFLLTNVKDSSEEYQIDPEEQVDVFNQLEEKNLELISIFHSHPKNPPFPSHRDLERAYYPEAIYTIISLISRKEEVRAFKIENYDYREVPINIC